MALPPKPPTTIRHDDDDTVSTKGELRDPFAAAAHTAGRTPEREAAWQRLEDLAKKEGRAEDAAAVYRAVLERPYPVDVAMRIAARAIAFHDEWIADAGAMAQLLGRVTEIDPSAEWAFERLSLLYTVAGRWDELLGLYDRALAAASPARKPRLLTEAARIAKDSASQPERAIRYLEQLFTLRPGDGQVVAALERLLQKQRRYGELIDLWTRRLPLLADAEAQALRASIANAWLNHLHDPRGALEAAAALFGDPGSDEAVCGLLARIVASPTADAEVRGRALGVLRERYDAAGRTDEMIEALEAVLPFAEGADRAPLHAEIVRRMLARGAETAARPHLAALVALDAAAWDDEVLASLLAPGGAMAAGPFALTMDERSARELVKEAATLAAGDLADADRAEALHRALLAARPDDVRAIEALSVLYERGGKREALVSLRGTSSGCRAGSSGGSRSASSSRGSRARPATRRARSARCARTWPRRAGTARPSTRSRRGSGARGGGPTSPTRSRPRRRRSSRRTTTRPRRRCGRRRRACARRSSATSIAWCAASSARSRSASPTRRSTRWRGSRSGVGGRRGLWAGSSGGSRARRPGRARRRCCASRTRCSRRGRARARRPCSSRGARRIRRRSRCSRRSRAASGRGAITRGSRARSKPGSGACATRTRSSRSGARRPPCCSIRSAIRPARSACCGRRSRWRRPIAACARRWPTCCARPAGSTRRRRSCAASSRSTASAGRRSARGCISCSRACSRRRATAARRSRSSSSRPGWTSGTRACSGGSASCCDDRGSSSARTGRSTRSCSSRRAPPRRGRGRARRSGWARRSSSCIAWRRCAATRRGRPRTSSRRSRPRRRARTRRGGSRRRSARRGTTRSCCGRSRRGARAEAGEAKAAALDALGDLFARTGRAGDALEARLDALGEAWTEARIGAAGAAAAAAGRSTGLEARLGALAEVARDRGDAPAEAALWLAVARSCEGRSALADAATALGRAEDAGERLAEVWAAEARVAALLRDEDGQIRALRRLADAGLATRERADVLYELAGLELGRAEEREAGLDTLAQASDVDPRPEEVCAILGRAAARAPDHDGLVRAYVEAARATRDDRALLRALDLASAGPRASEDVLEEAANLAERLADGARAKALLERAVAAEKARGDDLAGALWALRRLVARAKGEGDLAAAAALLGDAERAAPPDEARAFALEAAAIHAGPLGDLAGAIAIYQRLWDDDPTDATAWRPLLAALRKSGDAGRIERALGTAIDAAYDLAERSSLRVERARQLVGLGRPDDAATALAQTLDEEPEHPVAASLLADLYAERGRDDELADLLERQLDLARDHQDAAMVLRLALRLGALLAPRSPGRAADVYRAALAWAPESREVLRGLVGSLAEDDGERADRLEQLLVVEDGEDAVRTALALADQRTAQGDADGAERAIALGARKKPGDPRLVARLRAIAERRLEESQGDGGVPILRRVASLFAELGDRARAVEVLAAARARAPEDGEVLRDLARLWLSAGDAERVHTELAAVPGGIEPALAAELARLRSEACAALGLFDEAIAELDRAAGAGDAAASAELVPMLERARRAAAATGDADGERRATLRLASEATARGEAAKSTDVLARWIERAPEDEAALRAKLAADEALGDDEAAATGLARLATIGEAAARVDAAVRFADVVTKLGRPADARPVLEAVADEAPEAAPARARLRALYRALGAHRELASLLVAEAKRATDDAARFEALREAGRIRLIDLGEPTPAIGPLSDARALRPSDAELGLLLADAYIGARFFDEASQLLSEAIEKHGGRRTRELAVLQHHMAVLARAAGDEKTRVAWLGAALETFPQSGEIAAELAEAAMATGELELALKGLRIVALQKGPCPMSRAMAFVHQGTIAKRQGDAKKALFFARKAESEDPALAEAKALVADLLAGG